MLQYLFLSIFFAILFLSSTIRDLPFSGWLKVLPMFFHALYIVEDNDINWNNFHPRLFFASKILLAIADGLLQTYKSHIMKIIPIFGITWFLLATILSKTIYRNMIRNRYINF
jgi:Na+/glutamate symporter